MPATGGRLPRLQVGAYIGTIRADSIVPTAPIFQFTDLLTARLPGVDVQSGGGMSGSGARIIIRGTGSLVDGSDPVVYLDGIRIASDPSRPATGGGTDFIGQSPIGALGMSRLDDLSPNEIQRIDVLSGPAATTQYGLDAWNGVVLITTRRPAADAPRWTAYAEDGLLSPPSPRVADNYFGWGHAPGGGSIGRSCSIGAQIGGACVLDSITHFSPLDNGTTSPLANGSRDRLGLQVGGGAGLARYFLSGERQSEMGELEMPGPEVHAFTSEFGRAPLAGQLRPNSLDRTNLRTTLGAELGDHADISIFGNAIGGGHRSVNDFPLAEDVAFAGGSSAVAGGWFPGFRPSTTFATEGADRLERYIYGGTATWRPISLLTAHVSAGADRANTHAESLSPELVSAGQSPTFYTEATEHEVTTDYTGDANLTADIPAGHGWSSRISLGVQYREQRQANVYYEARSPIGAPFPDTAGGAFNAFWFHHDPIQRSAYIEETIGWTDRLTLTAALRAEGPRGLFGKATQGYPRIAASWSPLKYGDDGVRIHAAYGLTADLPAAQEYGIQSAVSSFLNSPSGGQSSPMPPLESIAEYEAGVDATWLHERIAVGATVYDRTISRMGFLVSLPGSVGGFNPGPPGDFVYSSTGIVRNRGVELTLAGNVVRNAILSWDANVVAWTNTNRVVTLGPNIAPIRSGLVYRITPGHPLYSTWEPTLSYHDANGDGIIEPNEVSLSRPVDQGSPVPTRGGSIQNSFAVLGGRFRIGALLDYKGGNKLIDNVLTDRLLLGETRGNVDRHAPLAEQAQQVGFDEQTETYLGPVEDASFVRFRELSFTVTAGPGIARALRTHSVALSLLARNLWLWTKYQGTDPEINLNGNADPVNTETVIPQPRYFVARVTLGY